jgi:hypothetical protein
MYVAIQRANMRLAEVYSVPGETKHAARNYGVFLFPDTDKECELYASAPEEAANMVAYAAIQSSPDHEVARE